MQKVVLIDNYINWQEQKEKLKKRFAILMEMDLILEVGYKKEMFEAIQLKLGITKAELHKLLTWTFKVNWKMALGMDALIIVI